MRVGRAFGALTLALAVASCSAIGNTDDDDGDDTSSSSGPPGTVRLSIGDPETLFPGDANIYNNLAVLEVLYSGLVRYDTESGDMYNYMAESIEPLDDANKEWEIKIQDGWTFQNGEPVNAAAFKRGWDYTVENELENAYFFERIQGYDDDDTDELSGVEADGLTLTVTLTDGFPGFPLILGYAAFFPVAEECLADVEACTTKPIGNGPFQVDGGLGEGKAITAERWDGYKGNETPTFDRVEWVQYDGDDSSWDDFLEGKLDAGAPPPSAWDKAVNDRDLAARLAERQGSGLTYLGFPLWMEPYDDVRVRQAISMAIDRQAAIEEAVPGQELPADSWVPPGLIPGGEEGTCAYCRFDPAGAKQLLKEAGGWPDGMTMNIYILADEANELYFAAIGDQIKENLGIDYKLHMLESADFYEQRGNKEFDGASRNNWFPDYPINENFLNPVYGGGKEGNDWGYSGGAFNTAVQNGDRAPDITASVRQYQHAERILADDFPTAPLSFSVTHIFYSSRLDNVTLLPYSGAVDLRTLAVND